MAQLEDIVAVTGMSRETIERVLGAARKERDPDIIYDGKSIVLAYTALKSGH